MSADNKLAEWAAAFLASYDDPAATATTAATGPDAQYPGVTSAAAALLRTVDAGGVPAFVTSNLKQIASDNGVVVSEQWTPNEIVDAIRKKVK